MSKIWIVWPRAGWLFWTSWTLNEQNLKDMTQGRMSATILPWTQRALTLQVEVNLSTLLPKTWLKAYQRTTLPRHSKKYLNVKLWKDTLLTFVHSCQDIPKSTPKFKESWQNDNIYWLFGACIDSICKVHEVEGVLSMIMPPSSDRLWSENPRS